MRFGPPVLPGSHQAVESPADRGLSLAIAEENDAALRWAAAIVKADPAMATALYMCGRLLGELGRKEVAREACTIAVERAIDLENLPLAVAAAQEIVELGGDSSAQLDSIASAFCKDSPRRGEGATPPPQLPAADDFHPLPSVLTGAALLNKATQIVHEAKRKLAEVDERPGISPNPLYSLLPRDGLRALCAAMTPIWVATDSTVIQQGATGSEAYFVARGELEARRTRDDQELSLARLTNGAIFGEMALLSRAPRTGSVVCLRPSIIVEVKKEALDALAKDHPEVAQELVTHCRSRMFQNLVKMSPVIQVVPSADRPALVSRFQVRTYEKSERLVIQDSTPDGIFLLASGEVAVLRHEGEGADDEPLLIKTLGTGDVVGEVALIFRRKANCDVVALHPTVTLYLPKEDFMGLIHDHPSILAELYLLACSRDEETASIIDEEAAEVTDFTLI